MIRTHNHLVRKRTLNYLAKLTVVLNDPVVVSLNSVAFTRNSDTTPVSSKEFLDFQVIVECRFTLKRLRDSFSCTICISLNDELFDEPEGVRTNYFSNTQFDMHIIQHWLPDNF